MKKLLLVLLLAVFGVILLTSGNAANAESSEVVISPFAHYEFEDPNNPGKDSSKHGFDLKVGKTSQPLQNRVYQHLNKDYKGIAYKAVIKNYFECDNDDDALTMENMLRKYYKQQNNEKDFLPLDRFTEQRYNPQVMQDKKVNLQYELLMS